MMLATSKPLKTLLSAYACEPGKGSEPGVGWNWALALARRGHDVWVLTRSNNRQAIEAAVASGNQLESAHINFLYYDLPKWASWWKNGNRGVHLYYLLWQLGAFMQARQQHRHTRFDLVHHVTFVSVRQPSFMGNLGIPFIFGPVAGGESAPWRLRLGFGWRGFVTDAVRDLANLAVRFGPLMRRTFRQAAHIYVTSKQTQDLLPNSFRSKSHVQLAIAAEMAPAFDGDAVAPCNEFRVLYVGNFLYLKGMTLGLQAFGKLLKAYPDARLSMIGKGPEQVQLQHLADELGIADRITWHPWLPQAELAKVYGAHDVLLFPSLRDSGGMVVLEAMSFGLPVVCCKLGGPGVSVDSSCGRAVDVAQDNVQVATQKLADALIELAASPTLRQQLSQGSRAKAAHSTWDEAVARIYEVVEQDFVRNKIAAIETTAQVTA